MQNISETKFKKIIGRRNTLTYINYKVAVRFIVLFIVGLSLGIVAFFSEYRIDGTFDYGVLNDHFESIFVKCETISDYSVSILFASEKDIRYIIFIFISGFTYFCFIASGAIVFSKGFIVGFASAYIVLVKKISPDLFPDIFVLIFIFINLTISAIIIHLATKGYIFSYEFRAIKKNHSILRRAPITYRYIASLILALGGILIFNLLYCLTVATI